MTPSTFLAIYLSTTSTTPDDDHAEPVRVTVPSMREPSDPITAPLAAGA